MILDKAPLKNIIFSGNPVEISLRKNNININTSGYPYLVLCFDMGAPPAAAQTLILDFPTTGATPVSFTFANPPLFSGAENLSAYVSGSADDYGKQLAADIYRHPLINRYYFVNYIGYDTTSNNVLMIQIIARQRGMDYNLSIDASSTVTLNLATPSRTQQYTDDDTPLPDWKAEARSTIMLDFVYNPTPLDVNKLTAAPRINNDVNEAVVTFHELPEIADSLLLADIPDNAWVILPNRKSFAQLILEITEKYDGGFQLVVNILQNTDVYIKTALQQQGDLNYGSHINFTVLGKAGSRLDKYPFDNNFGIWIEGTLSAIKFLSLQPNRTKLLDVNQPEWLNFFFPFDPGPYYLQFTVYYTDGSNATQNTDFNQLLNGTIISFPTGWLQNNLAALNPSLTPIYYTAAVWQPGSPDAILSEVFTYVIDNRFFRDTRYFIYQNSYGQIDTLRVVGVQKFTVKRNQTNTTRALTGDARGSRGSIEMVYNELEERWTIRTGWLLSRDEKEYLLDFLRSTYVAEIIMPLLTPDTTVDLTPATVPVYYKQPYKSVIVDQQSIDMYQWDDGSWGLQFDIYYAHKGIMYSNIPALAEQWFDTHIDFTIEILAASTLTLFFDQNWQLYLNGVLQTVANFTLDVGIYHFKFSGSGTTIFTFNLTSGEATLAISKYETAAITELNFEGFDNIYDDFLCTRLAQYSPLTVFSLISAVDPGFSIDKILASISKLVQWQFANWGYTNITTLYFPNSTPSLAGQSIGNYLINQFGIGVTTL